MESSSWWTIGTIGSAIAIVSTTVFLIVWLMKVKRFSKNRHIEISSVEQLQDSESSNIKESDDTNAVASSSEQEQKFPFTVEALHRWFAAVEKRLAASGHPCVVDVASNTLYVEHFVHPNQCSMLVSLTEKLSESKRNIRTSRSREVNDDVSTSQTNLFIRGSRTTSSFRSYEQSSGKFVLDLGQRDEQTTDEQFFVHALERQIARVVGEDPSSIFEHKSGRKALPFLQIVSAGSLEEANRLIANTSNERRFGAHVDISGNSKSDESAVVRVFGLLGVRVVRSESSRSHRETNTYSNDEQYDESDIDSESTDLDKDVNLSAHAQSRMNPLRTQSLAESARRIERWADPDEEHVCLAFEDGKQVPLFVGDLVCQAPTIDAVKRSRISQVSHPSHAMRPWRPVQFYFFHLDCPIDPAKY